MGWFTIEDKAQAAQPQAAATASYDAGASGVYEAPSVFDNSYSDPKAEKLGEDLLRWSLCSLSVNLAIAICFAVAWIPGVDWFSIAYFNGNPEQGQNVGIVGGELAGKASLTPVLACSHPQVCPSTSLLLPLFPHLL